MIGYILNKRFNAYKYLNCKAQPKLYNSFNKYGFENHRIEILSILNNINLNEKEIYWIEYFNTVEKGLNIKLGGDGGGKLSDETKNKISESNKGKTLGLKFTKDRINNIQNKRNETMKYNLENKGYKLGVSNRKTSGGFKWKYKNNKNN